MQMRKFNKTNNLNGSKSTIKKGEKNIINKKSILILLNMECIKPKTQKNKLQSTNFLYEIIRSGRKEGRKK